ncbi:MAG: hypothetical protein HY360_25615 [Verrucomicrobia bacterium]|nr:hypothetical protein [Verrucomicrobiota bacterium]
MIATPQNVSIIGKGLDHPECVCIAPDGTVYAGGEAGKLYLANLGGSHVSVVRTDLMPLPLHHPTFP